MLPEGGRPEDGDLMLEGVTMHGLVVACHCKCSQNVDHVEPSERQDLYGEGRVRAVRMKMNPILAI